MWLRCGEKRLTFIMFQIFLGNYIIHGENMSVKFEFYDKIENLLYLYSIIYQIINIIDIN